MVFVLGCSHEQKTHLQNFSLSDVRLLDGPFLRAQQADLKYMLSLDPDRLLAPYLREAGIEPLADNYPNWENTGLDGHIAGHYLSALSFMYASTGSREALDRINYMTSWIDSCQERNGNGYVAGIPGGKELWDEIKSGDIEAKPFSLNGKWVPLYNIHKLFAGLRDAYLNTGNGQAKDILVKLTDWFMNLTGGLTDDQVQEMLISEHGGLNEVFVDVAKITGDNKYLALARRFSDRRLLDPLLERKNELTGLHSNMQIPKVIGFKHLADATRDSAWNGAAEYFWNLMVNDWTVSIGGNSVKEHLNPPDDFSSMIRSVQGPETCNTYNMLKLTRLLYLSDPEKKYLDYYERALYNHILSSEDTRHGGFVYFTPMRPRHYRVYSSPQQSFWCCVGTGMENHGKYGRMIYAHNKKDLYVNLFIPSVLTWKEKGITLTQHTEFPYSDTTELTLKTDGSQRFRLYIRVPGWVVKDGFEISVNGQLQDISTGSAAYISINRDWESGDKITVTLPMSTKIEYLPDHSPWVSILHGPIVLAAISDSSGLEGLWADSSRWGHVPNGPRYPLDETPYLVFPDSDITAYIRAVPGKPLTYTMPDLLHPDSCKDMELKPFFDIQEARYIIYWPVKSGESSGDDG